MKSKQASKPSVKRKLDRAVVKKCLSCNHESPVATKLCQCGYQFSSRARLVVQSPEKADKIHSLKELMENKQHRFRSKRMRPDFFNPLDIEYATKRKVKVVESRRKRGRPKGSLNKVKEAEVTKASPPPAEDDGMSHVTVSKEKLLQFDIVLQELSHKFCRQNFKPT